MAGKVLVQKELCSQKEFCTFLAGGRWWVVSTGGRKGGERWADPTSQVASCREFPTCRNLTTFSSWGKV